MGSAMANFDRFAPCVSCCEPDDPCIACKDRVYPEELIVTFFGVLPGVNATCNCVSLNDSWVVSLETNCIIQGDVCYALYSAEFPVAVCTGYTLVVEAIVRWYPEAGVRTVTASAWKMSGGIRSNLLTFLYDGGTGDEPLDCMTLNLELQTITTTLIGECDERTATCTVMTP